jgi:peptidoglycan hydrolase-like protein with peptidoglycan-binding domain
MSSTVSAGQAAEQQAGAAMTAEAGGPRRAGRRCWLLAGVVAVVVAVVVAAGVVVAGVSGAFGRPAHSSAGNGYHTSTATVHRQSLTSQTQVDATLGDGGSYSVVNQATGTITALPAAGQVVRQGQVLYQVSGIPVVLLYGQVPAYRDLTGGMTGPDVTELNADLVKLGYATSAQLDPRSGYFSPETAYALERLQARLGVTITGTLALGQAVFLPAAIQVTALGPTTVPGGTATPGSAVLTASSTTPEVTIALDAAQQSEVKVGEHVTITLPDGHNTPGVVSSVGTVATAPSSASSGGSGSSSGGSASIPTITVEVTLSNPKAAGHLNQAPVVVTITTGSVSSALVVPVDALLAQANGGYAVEVTGPRGHHLVAVSPGEFDDAAGLVQVSGAGLAAGQRVVVPAI